MLLENEHTYVACVWAAFGGRIALLVHDFHGVLDRLGVDVFQKFCFYRLFAIRAPLHAHGEQHFDLVLLLEGRVLSGVIAFLRRAEVGDDTVDRVGRRDLLCQEVWLRGGVSEASCGGSLC